MRPEKRLILPFVAAALLGGSLLGGLAAARGEGSKAPARVDPAKALRTAVRNLVKAKSYRVRVTIDGGISESEDHAIKLRTVGEVYEGEVFGRLGPLMHVPSEKAFRYPTKGVALVDGVWKNILSDRRTILLQRLFTFPEVILGRALKNAPRSCRWLEPKKGELPGVPSIEEASSEPEEAPSEEASGEGASRGKTAVADPGKDAKGSAAAEAGVPRVVRVEAPPKEALEHFLEVQNSGCLSAG